MAELQCPNCGKNNPDFLDACQFCQSPLRLETSLQIGESPVKKNTGELEPILPQWLREVRQQGRASAAEDAAEEAAKPKVPKNEPPDLLAGLASQARSEKEEIPDWLAGINPPTKPKTVVPPEPEIDFFAQFNKGEPPLAELGKAPIQDDVLAWRAGAGEPPPPQPAERKDELSDWLAKAAAEPSVPIEIDSDNPEWMNTSESPSYSFKEPAPQQKEEENLDWLHSLEDSARKGIQPIGLQDESASQPDLGQTPTDASKAEDLSWLNQLGGGEAFIPGPSEPAKPTMPQEDLSWLNALGSSSEPVVQQLNTPQPASDSGALDWLDKLGTQDVTPFEKESGEDELSKAKNLDDKRMEETPPPIVSPFVPRRTGLLEGDLTGDSIPDWLKEATEDPSTPAPGVTSGWFRESDTDVVPPRSDEPSMLQSFDRTQGGAVSAGLTDFNTTRDSQSPPNQDVDSLLSADMPDWLSQPEPGSMEKTSSNSEISGNDSLSPVDLPSWVQAMRPVESLITETPGTESQPTENEGPLAGLSGVIPIAPIGSSRRPRAFSMKLQASDEQQAGAALFEKILSSESNPRPLPLQAQIKTSRAIRWLLSGLFLIVLGAMSYLRSESLPVSAALPVEVRSASSVIARLPQNSFVLVVMDYEPSLAGEMEAVSGPMLDQLVLMTRARLTFLSTSPNGSGLVRRLLINTGIGLPAPVGLDYKQGENYTNLGYLPGGPSGVREFIESPTAAVPLANVTDFSNYAAVIVLTDNAESGRVWVEQLDARNQADSYFSFQPLLFAASAQAGPMLKPYFSSNQIMGLVSGLADAVRYEFVNNSRPGTARIYWDSFGVGLLMAVVLITLGSLWSLFTGFRARRAEAGLG